MLLSNGTRVNEVAAKYINIFLNKVVERPGCWEYNGAKDRDGYGAHSYLIEDGTRIKVGAHRFMMLIQGTVIPPDYVVCHKCDNPSCVNPAHLFVGTVDDNNQDKVRKNRNSRFPGSKNAMSKINEETARKIKSEAIVGQSVGYNNGSNIKQVAAKYNVCTETVRKIAQSETWKHL